MFPSNISGVFIQNLTYDYHHVNNSPCSWVLSAAFPCVSQTDVILTWHLTWHSSHWKVKTLTVSLIHFIFPIRFLLFLFCIFQPCHFCLEVSLELSIYVCICVGEGGSESVNGSRKTTTTTKGKRKRRRARNL